MQDFISQRISHCVLEKKVAYPCVVGIEFAGVGIRVQSPGRQSLQAPVFQRSVLIVEVVHLDTAAARIPLVLQQRTNTLEAAMFTLGRQVVSGDVPR